jgi:hypothetical protein
MILHHYLLEVVTVKVRVNLRSGDGLVPQHGLHGPQVGSTLNEMRSKRVPKSVRADILAKANVAGQLLDDQEYHHPTQRATSAIQEDDVIGSLLDLELTPHVLHVQQGVLEGVGAYGYEPYFIAFAKHPYKT